MAEGADLVAKASTVPSLPSPPFARPTTHLPGKGTQPARRQEAALETPQQARGIHVLLARHGWAGPRRCPGYETEAGRCPEEAGLEAGQGAGLEACPRGARMGAGPRHRRGGVWVWRQNWAALSSEPSLGASREAKGQVTVLAVPSPL